MSNDEQKTNELQEVPVQTPTLVAPTEADETALKLTAIESEKPSGEAAGNTPAAEAEPHSAEQANEPQLDEAKEPTTAALVNVPEPSQPKPSKVAGLFTSKKQAVIAAVMAGVLVLGGGAAAFALLYQAPVPEAQVADTTQVKQVAKMGVAVTLVDGAAEYQRGAGAWQALTDDSQLKEGDAVRTADGRVVLTLDDGSALRLDANTNVTLTSLVATDVKIAQTGGTAYSRVVPSERSYTVTVDGAEYKALGTAFSTINHTDEKGVQVYQSSVKVKGVTDAVTEGKQYFKASADAALKDKVTDINLDTAAENEFLQWNLGEDEKVDTFKSKLGVLPKVKERAEQKAKEQEEATAKAKAEAEARQKAAEKEKTTKKDGKNEQKDKVTRGSITATAQGTTINWSYTGKAVHGYKLVYSKNTNTPTFGFDNAIYYSDPASTSGKLSNKDGLPSGTYWVRICAYTAGSESEPCVDYSDTVNVQKP